MKRSFLLLALTLLCLCVPSAKAQSIASPDGRLTIQVKGKGVTVCCEQQPVLDIPTISDRPLSLALVGQVTADYTMVTGKRLHCTNQANEYRSRALTLRVYNDGIAFRYADKTGETIYHIPEGTRRWMQQWCDSYEGFFPLTMTYKVEPIPSYSGISKSDEGWNNRWGYPALLEVKDEKKEVQGEKREVKGKKKEVQGEKKEVQGETFVLLTEANIERGQSASCLMNEGELFRVVPAEQNAEGASDHTPWRVAIIGSLADVVESTLVTDVSEPSKIADTNWIQPGVASWIYWAYNHGSNDYDIICKYVDMAATLHLPYVLIDAEWDEMKNGKTIEDAVAYAKEKGIRPLIWYNSSVGWVDGAPGPKFRLNKAEDREKEFAWCERIGVAGVKIDFFSGDNQRNMDYSQDLLESAARHHLLVNFHGATIPRGWQRTWPNLMTTEGVYGAEWYNNVPTFTSQAARHNATLPFTRNVIGSMDYTPCAFSDSQYPHITSHAHELALTVLFESGLQHLADRPESLLSQPQQVQDFFGSLPTAWDEIRLLSGYPGESVVLARRNGNTWYVAGINGTDQPQSLAFPTDFLKGAAQQMTLFADSEQGGWSIQALKEVPTKVACLPRGGFIIRIQNQ